MQSQAATVAAYLKELPGERRTVLESVRSTILKHLPKGYEETMQYGMISYVVPLARYPQGYLDKKDTPLPYIALAAQKNYFALYLMNVYGNKTLQKKFEEAWRAKGKKLDMGKSCVRFKAIDDLPLNVIGEAVAYTSVDAFIKDYEHGRGALAKKKK